MLVCPFAFDLGRSEVMEFAGLIGGSGAALLVKYPETKISNFAVVEPFSWEVNRKHIFKKHESCPLIV